MASTVYETDNCPTARSGGERSNHEATASQTKNDGGHETKLRLIKVQCFENV